MILYMSRSIDITEILANNLRHYMKAKKYSAVDLSKKSGVSLRTINYILSGDNNPSVKILSDLAAVFDIHPAELITQPSDKAEAIKRAIGGLKESDVNETLRYIAFIKSGR